MTTIKRTGFAPRRHYDDKIECSSEASANLLKKKHISPRYFGKSKKDKIAELSVATSILAIEEALKLEQAHILEDIKGGGFSNLYTQQTFNSVANGRAMKTPVSILQEILSRRGILPVYELLRIEGAIHEPLFRYKVSFTDKDVDFEATGAGSSKKKAKHAAARALIDKLTGLHKPEQQKEDPQSCSNPSQSSVVNKGSIMNLNEGNKGKDEENKIQINPIGWLQEMCMSRRWPPPCYETETEEGLPHLRLFTIACSVLTYREVGRGKSKKIAKRLAAQLMCNRLQENTADSNNQNEQKDDNVPDYYQDLKNANISVLDPQQSIKVSKFHKNLKDSDGNKLLQLQRICLKNPNLDYMQFLEDIAMENNFDIKYIDIKEKSYANEYQCLVKISSIVAGVCHGYGPTPADAQRKAAQNALEYLKIMSSKISNPKKEKPFDNQLTK